MTFADWTTSTRSKVATSQTLHDLLPHDLDFFIMLSSVAGIAGSPGQANYAAGNTFQDALARHRRALGLKATAIDLGVMGEVGIVAENAAYARGKEAAADLATIKEAEFLALLDYYCDPAPPLEREGSAADENHHDGMDAWKTQPIIGLVTPAQFRAKGMDPPDWMERPMFRSLAATTTIPSSSSSTTTATNNDASTRDFAAEFFAAAGPNNDDSRIEIVTAALRRKLSKALSVAEDAIDTARPLHTYGVDSLLAVELRNWFQRVFAKEVPVFDITGRKSVEVLVRGVVVGEGG